MLKLLKWLDEHLLQFFSVALIIFIPLYPKIPFADIIPGYIVRLRVDDFLVGLAFLIWIIQLYRKKVTLKNNPLFIPIALYIGIGFLSSLAAVFWTKTVPLEEIHISKLFLHFIRRIEYFSVFFIFFSSLKSSQQVKKYVFLIAIVFLAVSIYGFGQKYMYWPAFSTMNREFSKGVQLYLSENARVLSTFGGHYDLAAYVMMLLSLTVPLTLVAKRFILKSFFFIVSFTGFWILILTVSRTSFIAYIVAITAVFALLYTKKGLLWAGSRWFIVIFISLGIMLLFGNLSNRFSHVLKIDTTKIQQIVLSPFKNIKPPQGGNVAFLDVGSESDIPPSTTKPGSENESTRPADVTEDIPDGSTTNESGTSTTARVYSQNALKYDLSTAIRLDYTWPKAIEGFVKNPLLGSGYSTLTKKSFTDFTEAESTDSDFLRALGETGLLGFLTFFGVIGIACHQVIKKYKNVDDLTESAIVAGIFGAIIGLLVNAVYIDVFEASKVAYTFWMLIALLLALLNFSQKKPKNEKT